MNVGKHPRLIEQVWGPSLKAPSVPGHAHQRHIWNTFQGAESPHFPYPWMKPQHHLVKFLHAGVRGVSHGPKSYIWQTQWNTDALRFISYFCIYLLTTYLLGSSQKNVSTDRDFLSTQFTFLKCCMMNECNILFVDKIVMVRFYIIFRNIFRLSSLYAYIFPLQIDI